MVQFPGCRSSMLCIHIPVCGSPTARVTPFGYLRFSGCLLLTAAFRSLPRPSSPDSSKASSVDPYSLDHITCCPSLSRLHSLLERRSHVKDLFSPQPLLAKGGILTSQTALTIRNECVSFQYYCIIPLILTKINIVIKAEAISLSGRKYQPYLTTGWQYTQNLIPGSTPATRIN